MMFSKKVFLCGHVHKNMFTNALHGKFLRKLSVTINSIFYLYNHFTNNL